MFHFNQKFSIEWCCGRVHHETEPGTRVGARCCEQSGSTAPIHSRPPSIVDAVEHRFLLLNQCTLVDVSQDVLQQLNKPRFFRLKNNAHIKYAATVVDVIRLKVPGHS